MAVYTKLRRKRIVRLYADRSCYEDRLLVQVWTVAEGESAPVRRRISDLVPTTASAKSSTSFAPMPKRNPIPIAQFHSGLSADSKEISMNTESLKLNQRQRTALERLIGIARSDTGQSRKVANFLLAWWNAQECGGFDLTDLWNVDRSIAEDMLTVFSLLIHCIDYPDTLGYGREFNALIRAWRPALVAPRKPIHSSHLTEAQ